MEKARDYIQDTEAYRKREGKNNREKIIYVLHKRRWLKYMCKKYMEILLFCKALLDTEVHSYEALSR